MIKLEVDENEVHLRSEGFKKDLAAECILATAALASAFSLKRHEQHKGNAQVEHRSNERKAKGNRCNIRINQ